MTQAILTTSWDDGHVLDFRIAEMLEKYNLRGTFYIPKIAPCGVMSAEQMRQLNQSFEIGAHTVNHVYLTEVEPKLARTEIATSKLWLQNILGKDVPLFCPPAGKFVGDHLAMIKEAGFSAIRTVELMSVDAPRVHKDGPGAGLIEMPTTLQSMPHAPMTYFRNFARRFAVRNTWKYLLHGTTRDWPRIAERLLYLVTRRGGVFHLWGHSWEIDRFNQWKQLDQTLKLMSNALGEAKAMTNWEVCQTLVPRLLVPDQSSPVNAA